MGLFKNNPQGGIMDVIRCDEPSYLIWKWRPEGSELGEAKKENTIRWGSSIRVKPGSLAVFVYNNGAGTCQDIITGPYDGILETNNLPVLSNIIGLAYNGSTPFQAEIYFVNLAEIITTKFAVPYFEVSDPRFTGYSVPVAVRGTLNFKISDYDHFIKLHRLDNFDVSDLNNQIRDFLSKEIKSIVTNAPNDYSIPVAQIERRISEINDAAERKTIDKLNDKFAITVTDFSIGAIEVDKTSDSYKKLSRLVQAAESGSFFAQAATDIGDSWKTSGAKATAESKNILFDQKLGAISKASKLVTTLKEDRREEIGQLFTDVSGAGKKILKDVKGIVNGKKSVSTPPPIPGAKCYYIADNGQSIGPYNLNILQQMVADNKLFKDTLIWTEGMENWINASEDTDVAKLFD